MQDFRLPMQYIRQIAEQVGDMGADRQGWLEAHALHEAQLDQASYVAPYPCFQRLIEDALQVTGEPAFGLLLGERLVVNTHGILGYAAMNSATLRQAVQLVERYIGLRTSLVSISHAVHDGQDRILFAEPRPLDGIRQPVLEAVLLAIKNILDYITLGAYGIEQVAFPFDRPEHAALAADLFKCEVRYGQAWAGFTLPPGVIDLPLKMADPGTFREAELICQRELERLPQKTSMSARVRRVMLEKQGGFPSLNLTARLFHLTPRTLHRRLLDEGTSFKAILEEVRRTLAVEHLKAGRMSIQEIAYTLGYTDMANFRRAFKRWETVSPSAYRSGDRDTNRSA